MTREIHKLQVARRAVQIAVVVVLLAIPAVSRYANYLAARELDKTLVKWDGSLQGETLALIDAGFRALPGGEKERVGQIVRDRERVLAYTQGFRGGPWSMEFAGVSMTDPLGAAESVVARKHIDKVLIISLIVPILVTVLLGRVFCSWICPVGFLLELTEKLRGLFRFLELRPQNVHFSRATKYTLLGGGLAMTAWLTTPVLSYIYPPAIVSREAHDLVFGMFDRGEAGRLGFWAGGLTWMSLIIVGIIVFEVMISRRWWCRYMCPGGALYGLLGAFRPVRVKLRESKCTRCADCIAACPVGLNPMENRMGIDCDSCGVCISVCHDDALGYGTARFIKEAPHDFSGTEAVASK